MTVAVQQPGQKKDPLETIMKGLTVANSILGIKANIDQSALAQKQSAERETALARQKILQDREDEAYAQAQADKKFAQAGGLSADKAAELTAKGFSFGPAGAAGSQQVTLRTPQGEQAFSLVAPKKEGISEYQKQMLELQKYKIAADQTKATEAQQKIVNEGARKLSDAIEKTGVTDVYTALDKLDKKIGIDGSEDIPGVGQTAMLPGIALSQEGKDVRQLIQGLTNTILKARSGGAITEPEAERLLAEIGTGITKTDADLRRGLQNVRDTFRIKLELAESGAPEESVSIYRQRKGSIHSQLPLFMKKADQILEDELRNQNELPDLDALINEELDQRKNPRGGI